MIKLIIPFISVLLLCFTAFAQSVPFPGPAGVGVTATSCTTSNDSQLADETSGTKSNRAGNAWGQKISLAATTTVTQYHWFMCYNNSTGTVAAELYTHNAGTDKPNATISGSSVSVAKSSLTACGTPASVEFTLTTPLTGQASDTYWLVVYEAGGGDASASYSGSSGDRCCDSSDGGATWTCYADYHWHADLWGCQ